MNRFKRWLKATPAYPLLRAVRRALRRKSQVERIDRRDTRLTATADVFDELARHGLAVWHLGDRLAARPPLSRVAFASTDPNAYWNFLAGPADAP